MHILLVHIHVKPEFVDSFKEAILDNARNSLQEPGILRFDVLQQKDDPNRFTLVEVYRSVEDHAAHRLTPHYNRWRELSADWMAEGRIGVTYSNFFPTDADWR